MTTIADRVRRSEQLLSRYPQQRELRGGRSVELRLMSIRDEIRFLTVALDDHDNPGAIAQASEMLSRHEASFPHYVFASEISGSLATLGIRNVPAVLVYDAEGTPRHRLETGVFDNDLSVADIEDAIESLRSPPAAE